jgi:hypothetical protein
MSSYEPILPEPMELLDLEHGASIQLRIDKYDRGWTSIHPTVVTQRHVRLYMDQNGLTAPPAAGTPITVKIPVLRVYGQRLDEASPAPYWDITSKRLIADLATRLYASGGAPLTVTLTAVGYKPTKRYSVETGS